MNGKEILKIKIKQCREELAWLVGELKRIDTGEDAWGDPASLSEEERKSLASKEARSERFEAFRKLGDKDTMNEILAKVSGKNE